MAAIFDPNVRFATLHAANAATRVFLSIVVGDDGGVSINLYSIVVIFESDVAGDVFVKIHELRLVQHKAADRGANIIVGND